MEKIYSTNVVRESPKWKMPTIRHLPQVKLIKILFAFYCKLRQLYLTNNNARFM